MENLINNDLDPSSSGESDIESVMDLTMMNLIINLIMNLAMMNLIINMTMINLLNNKTVF